tara:strand:+ start:5110 stop:6183 length:1074 start_codon:yes stop_codon:yes gene_type:complete
MQAVPIATTEQPKGEVLPQPAPTPQSSIGVSRSVNQAVEYLGAIVTITTIEGDGENRIVRYRITEANGSSANYTAWPSRASHARPQPSPSGFVLVHIANATADRAGLELSSAMAMESGGIIVRATDGEAFHYAGVTFTPQQTLIRRTMSGGHVLMTSLEVEENGKTTQVGLSTSFGSDKKYSYGHSPDQTIKIAAINGDQGQASYHLVADGGELPRKDISELPAKPLSDQGQPLVDRESPHRVAVRFLGTSIKNNSLEATVELLNAGPATKIVIFPISDSGLLLQLPDETFRPEATGLPPGPPAPIEIEIPARHRITARMQVDLGDYVSRKNTTYRLDWSYLFWNEPRPSGTVFVKR